MMDQKPCRSYRNFPNVILLIVCFKLSHATSEPVVDGANGGSKTQVPGSADLLSTYSNVKVDGKMDTNVGDYVTPPPKGQSGPKNPLYSDSLWTESRHEDEVGIGPKSEKSPVGQSNTEIRPPYSNVKLEVGDQKSYEAISISSSENRNTGSQDPSFRVSSNKGNENNVETTKDDWFYNPDDDDVDIGENGEVENNNQENAIPNNDNNNIVVVDDDDDDDNDDEEDDDDNDDDSYDFWSKLQEIDKQNNEANAPEEDDGNKLDEDFDEKLMEDVVDEDLVKKNKPPTAPSKMVLFYTWMILAILIMVIGISTYQTRCKNVHLNGVRHQTREDRKRLVDHEYT